MIIENTINDFRRELLNLGYCKTIVNNYPKYAQNILDYTKEIPQKITDVHIKNYYEYLKTKPNKRRKGTISESHIYSQLLAIKLYFEYLERTRTIKRNPYNLRIKQTTKNERIVFTQEEIELLYKNTQNLEEKTILHLCYGCGLRRSEAQDLNIKDVNFEQKLLFIRKGKGKKRRVIPITAMIAKDFETYLQIRKSPSFGGVGEAAFLIDNRGNRMQGNTIYKTFKNLLKRSPFGGQGEISLHHLRHSIATHLLENEMGIEMVRNFLGHQNLNTTQIYTKINQLKMK